MIRKSAILDNPESLIPLKSLTPNVILEDNLVNLKMQCLNNYGCFKDSFFSGEDFDLQKIYISIKDRERDSRS